MNILTDAIRAFWTDQRENGISLRSGADAISFSCLGDFLFAGRPVTQSYFDSRISRIHLPRRIRVGR